MRFDVDDPRYKNFQHFSIGVFDDNDALMPAKAFDTDEGWVDVITTTPLGEQEVIRSFVPYTVRWVMDCRLVEIAAPHRRRIANAGDPFTEQDWQDSFGWDPKSGRCQCATVADCQRGRWLEEVN